jgi:hypothetical protein
MKSTLRRTHYWYSCHTYMYDVSERIREAYDLRLLLTKVKDPLPKEKLQMEGAGEAAQH